MKRTTLRAVAATAAALALAVAGCGSSDDDETTTAAASATTAAGATTAAPDLAGTKLAVGVGATSFSFLKAAREFDTPYELVPVDGATPKDLAAAVASGRADLLMLGDVITASLAANDLPFTIVYAQQRARDFCGILVPADSEVETVEQLKGKTVGNGVSTAGEVIAIRAFQEAGLDYQRDVKRIELATIPEQQAAFVSGKVDALAACTPPGGALVDAGRARWVVTGEGGLWNAQNYWVLSDKASRDPRKVAAAIDYLKRFKRSLAYTNEHTDELLAELSSAMQVPVEQLRGSFEDPIEPVAIDASVITGLQDTYDALATTDRVPRGKQLDGIFDDQYTAQIDG
ncbi:PhnD/SsuA/transferrin family substrate-binding protein [Conexibacter stalactiti]|uniref:PhnD/SsuA/transferrin family substrate-binding protein n=1 Tax=Conexibacter stalactiti TaxID=1940611 RepID=A0ABU4I0Q9_9ACTN|nr:PhnD/SsuA/transferrin family substrate-binding protein [Conexibacter stalactiti]MDW5598537.1 PhnD/SsuA/transferrin family substrate-binding protein [Conexibacter stalactiti]MEC5039179.1 PhnD/SsuA/transferrin family substrate-binding protein [Conexibacter stalactiti]